MKALVLWAAVTLFAAVGALLMVPREAEAQAPEQPSPWRQVPGGVAFMPQGSEARCGEAEGCVVFTLGALRGLLKQAAGSCGKVPAMPQAPARKGLDA